MRLALETSADRPPHDGRAGQAGSSVGIELHQTSEPAWPAFRDYHQKGGTTVSALQRDNKLVPVSPNRKRLQNPHIFVLRTEVLDAGAMCE